MTGYGIPTPSDPPSATDVTPITTVVDPATSKILPAGTPQLVTGGLKIDLKTDPNAPVKVTISLDGSSDTATTST